MQVTERVTNRGLAHAVMTAMLLSSFSRAEAHRRMASSSCSTVAISTTAEETSSSHLRQEVVQIQVLNSSNSLKLVVQSQLHHLQPTSVVDRTWALLVPLTEQRTQEAVEAASTTVMETIVQDKAATIIPRCRLGK